LYDGKGANSDEELRERGKNVMSKKGLWLVAVSIVILAAGGYWYLAQRAGRVRVVEHTPEMPSSAKSTTPPISNPPIGTKEPAAEGERKTAIAPIAPALRTGETLEYAATISKLNSTIANIKVMVGDQKTIAGKATRHLQAFAHTENPYRMIFELDDQFDSYSELDALTSLQYEMHLSERGQKVDSIQRLSPSTKDVAPPGAIAARVLPGTRDPLGMLQYLRNVDWSKTAEVRSPVYDGRKLYDVRAVLRSRSAAVTVTAGKYSASKIEIHVVDNGTEMKDTNFLLYLSNDATRLPVLMEAVLPIATARVELTKVR
jgi:Protein of unknown function (DUF3108)